MNASSKPSNATTRYQSRVGSFPLIGINGINHRLLCGGFFIGYFMFYGDSLLLHRANHSVPRCNDEEFNYWLEPSWWICGWSNSRLCWPCNLNPFLGFKSEEVVAQFNESLTNLNIGCADICYLHLPDHNIPIEETLKGINQLHQGIVMLCSQPALSLKIISKGVYLLM